MGQTIKLLEMLLIGLLFSLYTLISADSSKEEGLTSMLEVAFEQARHLPTTGLYSSICNLLALQYLELCPLKAAYYLTEGMVVTFRHQSLVNCSRKIRYTL